MKKVTIILGLGVSGRAAAKFLLSQQMSSWVLGIDERGSELQLSEEMRELQALGLFIQNETDPIDWTRVEQLIVSPGISPKHPIYFAARNAGVPIVGEVELALRYTEYFQKPLLAVTGTNGKTTVTLLVEHVLNAVGIKAKALGNVGISLCDYLLSPGDEEVLVVELSSYQLETMHTPVFRGAVILNISADHLDRYEGMEDYARAKCHVQHLLKNEEGFFVQAQAAAAFGHLLTLKNYQTFEGDLPLACLPDLDYTKMGRHDCENALAAWMLCQLFSVSSQQFCKAHATFCRPPHRLEFVCEMGGVSYYDDSKGTNVDAVIHAVRAMKGNVILIAGGVDKGASYLPWKMCFSGIVKTIIAIGEAALKIEKELHPYFTIKHAKTLDLAVQMAKRDAEKGDSVLLSPGCSSYDMFRDFEHRGEEFKRAVQEVKDLEILGQE